MLILFGRKLSFGRHIKSVLLYVPRPAYMCAYRINVLTLRMVSSVQSKHTIVYVTCSSFCRVVVRCLCRVDRETPIEREGREGKGEGESLEIGLYTGCR